MTQEIWICLGIAFLVLYICIGFFVHFLLNCLRFVGAQIDRESYQPATAKEDYQAILLWFLIFFHHKKSRHGKKN